MSPKKRKRTTKERNIYDPKELAELGIYNDEDNDKEIDEEESWRYYG